MVKARKIIRDIVQGITSPQIHRLALRSGVERVSHLVYEETRALIKVVLSSILKITISITNHGRRKTVSPGDVRLALSLCGHHIVVGGTDNYTIPDGGKKKKLNALHSDKAKDSLLLARLPFQRLCRDIGMDYYDELRFSQQALHQLQIFIEHYVGEQFVQAKLILSKSKNNTLMPKHLQLVRTISSKYPVEVTASLLVNGRLPENTFSTLLKAVYGDQGLNKQATIMLHQTVSFLVSRIAAVAHELVTYGKGTTLSSREVHTAIQIVLPADIAQHAVSEATKALTLFNGSYGVKQKTRPNERAGLTVSISRCKNILKSARVADRYSKTSAVYLAGALEYILKELLEIAGKEAIKKKRLRISHSHLRKAIADDEEMSSLFNDAITSVAE